MDRLGLLFSEAVTIVVIAGLKEKRAFNSFQPF